MDLSVDVSDRRDRVGAVYRALVAAIREGRARPGDRLPPSRSLAADLGVSRTTTSAAYERLAAEGYVRTRPGGGTFVADHDRAARRRPAGGDLRPTDRWRQRPVPTSGAQPVPRFDFRPGLPDPAGFPYQTWRRLLAAQYRLRSDDPGSYADPAGHPELRTQIARHLRYSRGVWAGPEDVIVTNGTQQALDLVARVLLSPGDVAVVEDPGYQPAHRLWTAHGATVRAVPVDDHGLLTDRLPEAARLIHTTPSHQMPLGVALSQSRRQALLRWASGRPVAIVEDDYDSEFRFARRPLEPLQTQDRAERVIYVGSFSKSLLPTLRLGYLVAPASLREPLLAARQLADGFGAIGPQAALAAFLADGGYARHLRRLTRGYAAKREAMLAALAGHFGDRIRLVPSAAGLHLTAELVDGSDGAALVAAAGRLGIGLDALEDYQTGDRSRTGLVLGFGPTDPDTIDPGVRLLAGVRTTATPHPR